MPYNGEICGVPHVSARSLPFSFPYVPRHIVVYGRDDDLQRIGGGNRLTRTMNGVTETYAYDDGEKLLGVSVGGSVVKSYGYDAAGRTTSVVSSAGTTTLAYDFESRATSIVGPGVSQVNVYNGLDTRVGSTTNAVSRTFLRDGAYVTDPVLADGAATYTPGVSERRGAVTTFLHYGVKNDDAQSGTTQSVIASRQYDAFGNLIGSSGTWSGAFGYGGGYGYQEDATGLKLLGHRYYDSSTGRFLTRDIAKDGRNWYTYCGNDPLGGTDPEGLWRRTVGAIAGGIAGFILTGGNPLGAAAGAAIGGAIGSAGDQAAEKGEVDWGQAALDGAVDGAVSYVGGAVVGKLVKLAIPMQLADDGTVTFVHYTTKEGAEAIAESGIIRPGGAGLGSTGGNVYGLPKPMPSYAKIMGVPTEEAIIVQVPASNVTQNGLGHLLHEGPVLLQ